MILNIALYINVRKRMGLRDSCFKVLLIMKSYLVDLFVDSLLIWFLISAGVIDFIGRDIGKKVSIHF